MTFSDSGQTVRYDFSEKKLTVSVSERTAAKMKSDGWNVHFDSELGNCVKIVLTS